MTDLQISGHLHSMPTGQKSEDVGFISLFVLSSSIFSSYFLLNEYLFTCLFLQSQMLTERGGSEQTMALSQCPSPANNLPCQRTPVLPEQYWPKSQGESLPFASTLLAGSFHVSGGSLLSVKERNPDTSQRPGCDKL